MSKKISQILPFVEQFWKDVNEFHKEGTVETIEHWFEILLPDQIGYWLTRGFALKIIEIEGMEMVYNQMKNWNDTLSNLLNKEEEEKLDIFEGKEVKHG